MASVETKRMHHTADAKHTEVIVIGNGPSAISLSFMLSGRKPYYNGAPLSNEYLEQRLKDDPDASLYDQDLAYLSDGLEGRSNNPVALLFDQLFHPDADQGVDSPSALDWRIDSRRSIPHVVLGKTKPGGTWQNIDGSMQTISQNSWMELPNVPFKKWLERKVRRRRLSESERELVPGRASIADVKDYYTDYIRSQNLEGNFRDYHTVTSVQPVYHYKNSVDNESGEVEPCCRNVRRNHTHCWEVRGYVTSTKSHKSQHRLADGDTGEEREQEEEEEVVTRQDFCYVAPHVVLAVGAYDVPNRLGVEGENLPCVVHSLGDFERKLLQLRLVETSIDVDHGNSSAPRDSNLMCVSSDCCEVDINGNSSQQLISPPPDPVLVVGAGLSAADAILTAMEAGIPVIHVFRRSPNHASLIFSKLPRAMYPEYHRVHRLMKGVEKSDLYTPMPKQVVMEVRDQAVLVGSATSRSATAFLSSSPPTSTSAASTTTTSLTWIDVSVVAIMAGSRADLSFLPREGRDLGVVAKWPIDSKHNIMDVDPFTYQSNRMPQLFAMGPLVGDNFVRFGIGGALGIVNHLSKCHKKDTL